MELLNALRRHLDEVSQVKYPSAKVCEWLNDQDDLPYKDWRNGKGINQRGLARKLKLFDITSKNLNTGEGKRPKGYLREELIPVFERYLPPLTPTSEPLPATTPEKTGSKEQTCPLPQATVADAETSISPDENGHSSGVADKSACVEEVF